MFIDIHTHKTYNTASVAFIRSFTPDQYNYSVARCSVGVHPWFPDNESINMLESLLETQSNIVAIGEIGIDKTKPEIELQEKIFVTQLDIASQYGLPVIIHCVHCFDMLLRIRKSYPNLQWIIHGFSGKKELAFQLLDKGINLSFGQNLVTNKEKFQNYFPSLPSGKIFLETDTSNLDISQIYRQAAGMLNLSVSALEKIIESNYKKVFDGKLA